MRKVYGLPLVLEYNGSEAWAAANWHEKLRLHDIAVRAERVSLTQADVVVTVSKVLGDDAARIGVPRERIIVYPNCIDPKIFDPSRFSAEDNLELRKRLGLSPDALVATFIGTFGTWHGVDFLARAIRRLIDENRPFVEKHGIRFLLVGDGLRMGEVRQMIGEPPYDNFVILPGLVRQHEAPAYLAASDIFLSPHVPNPDGSAFFGSPTKLFEYMAMDRPIIASDLGQIGKVLRGQYLDESAPPEKLAELFTPGDEDGFLSAFRRVVDNPQEARRMADSARKVALHSYTWDHHVAAILDKMRELGLMHSERTQERAA
jgi:glycosyltransferase involved in cell wall biosynthesis